MTSTTTTTERAAETLRGEFVRVAKELVAALDAGTIKPTMFAYMNGGAQRTEAVYNIPWDSPPLRPMLPAVTVMGAGAANHWFAEIFQEAITLQLQGEYHGPNGAFSFTLNYGETWEQARARL